MIGYSRLDAWPDNPWDEDLWDDNDCAKELKLEGDDYDDSKPE